ncbi:uncharacterized protein LOC142358202 [Convolutriloba macropyga]|uniref:uncharacterized protein LOC142358202 n=1 Tax=Convolutriloba macropyga TaxID=536237 RepID=UPI003F51CB83
MLAAQIFLFMLIVLCIFLLPTALGGFASPGSVASERRRFHSIGVNPKYEMENQIEKRRRDYKGSDNLHSIRKIMSLTTILHKYHKQLLQMSVRETLFLSHPIYQNLVSNVYVHHPMTTMGVLL